MRRLAAFDPFLPIQMGRWRRLTTPEGSGAAVSVRIMTPPPRVTGAPPHVNGEETLR